MFPEAEKKRGALKSLYKNILVEVLYQSRCVLLWVVWWNTFPLQKCKRLKKPERKSNRINGSYLTFFDIKRFFLRLSFWDCSATRRRQCSLLLLIRFFSSSISSSSLTSCPPLSPSSITFSSSVSIHFSCFLSLSLSDFNRTLTAFPPPVSPVFSPPSLLLHHSLCGNQSLLFHQNSKPLSHLTPPFPLYLFTLSLMVKDREISQGLSAQDRGSQLKGPLKPLDSSPSRSP